MQNVNVIRSQIRLDPYKFREHKIFGYTRTYAFLTCVNIRCCQYLKIFPEFDAYKSEIYCNLAFLTGFNLALLNCNLQTKQK